LFIKELARTGRDLRQGSERYDAGHTMTGQLQDRKKRMGKGRVENAEEGESMSSLQCCKSDIYKI